MAGGGHRRSSRRAHGRRAERGGVLGLLRRVDGRSISAGSLARLPGGRRAGREVGRGDDAVALGVVVLLGRALLDGSGRHGRWVTFLARGSLQPNFAEYSPYLLAARSFPFAHFRHFLRGGIISECESSRWTFGELSRGGVVGEGGGKQVPCLWLRSHALSGVELDASTIASRPIAAVSSRVGRAACV